MKTIFVLIPSLRLGGAEIQAIENAIVIKSTGVRVVFCTIHDPKADHFFFRIDEMTVMGIEIISLSDESVPQRPLGLIKGIFRFMQHRRKLKKVLAEISPDFVYTRLWYSSLLADFSLRSAKMAKTVRIYNEESNLSEWSCGRIKARIRKWLLKRADAWIVPCNGLFEQAITNGCPAATGHVFPNLPNVDIASQIGVVQGGGVVMGFLGRLSWPKGIDRLCAVARAYLPANPSDRLKIAGDGPMAVDIQDKLSDIIESGQVIMCGVQRDVASFLDGISVLILTSYFEGFANVIVEAFARGKPVVAFDVDYGPRDLIEPGRTGILIKDGDMDQMISALTEHRGKWDEFSNACLKVAKDRFSRSAQAERWKDLLQKSGGIVWGSNRN